MEYTRGLVMLLPTPRPPFDSGGGAYNGEKKLYEACETRNV